MGGRASKGPAAGEGLPWKKGGLHEPCQLSQETAGTAKEAWARQRRRKAWRGMPGAGGCPLATDHYQHRCPPGSLALLGEAEGLACTHEGPETSEGAVPLQRALRPGCCSMWGGGFDGARDALECCRGSLGLRKEFFNSCLHYNHLGSL